MVDNGTPNVIEFWRKQSFVGALANGYGIGQIEKGQTKVKYAGFL